MDDLIMLGLIWGFLGTVFGAAFWVANIEGGSRRNGRTMFLICAPMWAAAYHFMPLLGARP